MPKKQCCCATQPNPPFCCNPIYFKNFITLFGETMGEHAEVSPDDWIALQVPRPAFSTSDRRRWSNQTGVCNCCCGGCPEEPDSPDTGGFPSSVSQNPSIDGTKTRWSSINKFKKFITGKKSDNSKQFGDNEQSTKYEMLGGGGGPDTGPGQNFCNDGSPLPCFVNADEWCRGNQDTSDPAHIFCQRACCKMDRFNSRVSGAEPIFFAYKYSGCNLKWYPREYTFGKDPNVPQCTGFFTQRNDENGLYHSQNSCSPFANQRPYAGAGYNNFVDECSYNYFPERQYDGAFPCACAVFPHIHGGVRDSVFNRVNVKISSGELGYMPYMAPLAEPMLYAEETGCCWCAATGEQTRAWDLYSKAKRSLFGQLYPFSDQKGKQVSQTNPNQLGINCYFLPGYAEPGTNPRYRRGCYEWGISPYLLRVAKSDHKLGYDIWRHGRNSDYYHDFGPTFVGVQADPVTITKDWNIAFKKLSGRKTTLKQQYVGFIQLEHRFECYAYRSDSGSNTIEMLALQNNCNLIVGPFERGYAGTYSNIGGAYYRWNPYKFSSIMWQVRRGVPRRVIYTGSGIPLFHFDLIAMENLTKEDTSIIGPGGSSFDGAKFLEHYNRYYFSMIFYSAGGCVEVGGSAEPIEWNFNHLLDSYEYVNGWLQLMIQHGILRIKDHAIDIAEEVNKVISAGTYITNDQGEQELFIDDRVALETGGLDGYLELLNFLGVCAGAENAITPKIIKQKLLNTDGLAGFTGPSGDREQFRMFLPRRARLPLAEVRSGLTAWGCSQNAEPTDVYDGISCASYIELSKTIPAPLVEQNEESIFSNLSPINVYCGLAGTFVQDRTGKLFVFGGVPDGGDDGPCPFENGISDSLIMYPRSIVCIPWYLDAFSLFAPDGNGGFVLQNPIYIPDGRVVDFTFTSPKLAAALLEFENGGLGFPCSYQQGTEQDENPAYEAGDMTPEYNVLNCNGSNIGFVSPLGMVCMKNEPFQLIPGPAGTFIPGPRAAILSGTPRVQTFRIKSWGSQSAIYGTFSLAKEDALLYNFPVDGDNPRGWDSFMNPDNLRYPGTNTWFIWTAIASGMEHFAALDDVGGVFITPRSSNDDGQSVKGIPLAYNSIYNSDPENGYADMYHGFESRFNYFNHIPRPGFIPEEHWSQELYNSLTFVNSNYRIYVCTCPISNPGCHPFPPGGSNQDPTNCVYSAIKVEDEQGNCVVANPPVYDSTCILMGSYVQTAGGTNLESQGAYSPYQPSYTKLAAGHFNTMLLTNENRVEIYGKYYQLDQNGNKIGPLVEDENKNLILRGITAFVPAEVLALQGTWNITYGCGFTCDNVYHLPIIDYQYNQSASNSITTIKSSCDYSICVTANNEVYVWGDASMIPGGYDSSTYVPGTTASVNLDIPGTYKQNVTIKNVAAGINSFYIHYSVRIPGTNFQSDRVYSYTRYGKENFGTETPIDLQNKPIADISSGFNFAVAVYSDGLEAKKWDYASFAPDTQKFQYKNFQSIPPYFKRDAYFHAFPGSWDFSKWLYGGNCCTAITDVTHPCLKQDTCAALAYNIYEENSENGGWNPNLSYSGHPEYFWMRTDWRRLTNQSFTTVKNTVLSNPGSCDPNGSQINSDDGTEVSNLYGFCYNDMGSVWAEGRPMADAIIQNVKLPVIPRCVDNSDDSCYPDINFHNRGVIPDDVPSLSREYIFNPIVSYRANKDVFQMMTTRYESDAWSSDGAVPCAKHQISPISYFKYCERHYYFGYDRETDTYDIYLNPDFIRNIGPNGLGWTGPEPPQSGGMTVIAQWPEYGFGGGTGPDGGTLAGICGYYSLYLYPMSGLNYAREDWVYTPMYVINNVFIGGAAHGLLCRQQEGSNECYTCGKPTGANILPYFGGPGAFLFRAPCGQGSSIPQDNVQVMWNRFAKYVPYYKTLSPSEMLKGVNSTISLTIPPESDPNFVKFGFADVLKSDDYTETNEPWTFGNSTKWIPIFIEPPVTCFSGTEQPNVTGNIVYKMGQDYFSVPVTCRLQECCGDPE